MSRRILSAVIGASLLLLSACVAFASTKLAHPYSNEEVFTQAEVVAAVRFTGNVIVATVIHEYVTHEDGSIGPVPVLMTRYEVEIEKHIAGAVTPTRFFVHVVTGTLGGGSKIPPTPQMPAPGMRVVLPMHVDLSPGEPGYVILFNRVFQAAADAELVALEAKVTAARRNKSGE